MIYRYLPYTLTLNAPAIMTSLGGDPNSARTLPFIPGSAIRGAVARALGDPGDDAEKQESFQKLVLGGGVRYLNAYPRAGSRRSLPKPVSFRARKDSMGSGRKEECKVLDLSAYDKEEWPDDPLVDVPEPFVTLGAARPIQAAPERGSRIHHQRDRAKGRAWVEPETEVAHGTIFTFEYLEAGQQFDGLIQVFGESEEIVQARAERIRELLGSHLLIGRSRRGGYGGNATIKWREDRDREVNGVGVIAGDIPKDTEFRVLLVSDYIGRNPQTGQLDPTYLTHEITQRLGGRAEVIRRCWKFGLTGGFNRKWRLEVPQAPVCVAGSVVVLRATAAISFEDIELIEHEGFGERRVEGFGRVVFLEHAKHSIDVRRPAADTSSQRAEGKPPEMVVFAEKRIMLKEIARSIQEEAVRLGKSAKSLPSTSLIGRLRNVLRGEASQALSTLREWLAEEGSGENRLKQPAMEQLECCRIGDDNKKLSDWLRNLVHNDNKGQTLADTLRLDVLAQRYHLVSSSTARQCIEECEDELRVRFMDATLAVLARRARGGIS